MVKFGYVFFKGLLYLIVFLSILIVLSSTYIYYNKEQLVGKFLSELQDQVELDFHYSTIELNLISHFPYATLYVRDLVVKYPTKSNVGNLLNAKQLSFTINTINLIRGNYNIKNCIVETGELNYYPKIIDSIINQFTTPEVNKNNTDISVNKFNLINFDINIYSNLNEPSINLKVINSIVMLNLKNEDIELSFKSELDKLIVNRKSLINFPINIQGHITGNENSYNFKYLGLNYNSIEIELTGTYNKKTELCKLSFASNHFNLKNLRDFIPSDIGISNVSGKSRVFGELEYSARLNFITHLRVNHSSKGFFSLKNRVFNIVDLNGVSTFSNNFKTHNTNIHLLNLKYDCYSFKLKGKVKGLNNPTILTEGEIIVDKPKINFLNKPIELKADGTIKVLLSISNLLSAENTSINYHNIKGKINYSIDKIEDIDRIKNIAGEIKLDNNLEIESHGWFDDEPFFVTLNQSDFLSIMNGKTTLSPKVEVTAETLDVDYFMELMDQLPSNYSNDKTREYYNVNLTSKNLKFFDYVFKDVKSQLFYSNDIFEIQNFSGNGFEGKINGSLKNIDSKYFISSEFNSININKLFLHYNNFNQSIVTNENISGYLSGSANLTFKTNSDGNMDNPSLKLESDLVLQNGKLVGMNKIQKLSKWLKLDQVKSIDFKTLRNRIEISNQCVRIPKMDIMSNVINMQLSGEHFFSGNYTYWMKVNFSQVLSRRFLNFSAAADHNNSSDGSINLYLKLVGDSNDYEVKIDKKSSFEKIKGNFESDGILMKDILKEEFNHIIKKDTITNSKLMDSTINKNPKFRIEWDEYDTLKVENN